ncbi:beta strand repeat-containing protein [Nocardioides sp.]|uniref:beta strand repeat-containing protein n=1 Tax=Nocardioides sp. TaxID=35761 RepID=UPI003562C4A3
MKLHTRFLTLSVATGLAIFGLALPAAAASPDIVTRTPAEDSFVSTAPSGVSITFDQSVATSSTISVSGPAMSPPCTKNAPNVSPGATLSCQFVGPVPDGTYTVSYTANSTGADPATTGSYSFHVDATSPGDPTVTTTNPVDGGAKKSAGFTYVVNASETLDGSSRVDLFDNTLTQVSVTKTVSGSTITTTPVGTLPEGVYTAKIYLVDVSGRTPASTTRTFSVDDTAPAAPVITTPLPKVNIANASAFPVSGTGEAGATVTLSSSGTNVMTAVTGGGAWSTTINVSSQSDGTISFSATQRDAAQNLSAVSTPATTPKDTVRPRVTGQAAAPTRLNKAGTTATVTGKVDNGSTTAGEADAVSVSANDTNGATPAVVATGNSAGDGQFSINVDTASLNDGTITYTILATDTFGNPSNAVTTTNTKDTVAPNAPTVTFSPTTVNNANKASVTISGAATGAATSADIVVSDGDAGTPDLTYTATVSGGTYSRAFDMTPLVDGTLTATVKAKDAHGNVGPSTSATAIKDVVAPGTPNVTVTPSPITNATQNSVTVSGTTNGDSVSITLSDGPGGGDDVTGTATASGGAYSKTFDTSSLSDGSITVSAVARDTAGNSSGTGSIMVTKDTVVPGQPSTLSATPSTYLPASTTLSISGNTAAGDALASGLLADITVSDTDGVSPDLTATGVSVSSGSFSTSFSKMQVGQLVDGTLTVTAKIRDAAGNVSPARTTTVTKNTGEITLSVTTPADGTTVQSPASVQATYTENLNATTSTIMVKNKNNTNVAGTSSINAKTISFAPSSPLTEAGSPFTVTVHAVDAGDAADTEDDTFSFSVDNTAAPQPTISSATNPVVPGNQATVAVSGNAGEAGVSVTVTISDGGTSVTKSTTATGGGAFSVSDMNVSGLADGTLEVTARSTDGSGNQSVVSATTEILKDTVAPSKTSGSPAGGSTVAPPATVSITFDEPLGSGSITIPGVSGSSAVDGSTVTFTPDATIPDGEHTASASVSDVAGNAGTGSTTFTVDGVVPVKVSASPADGMTVTPPATVSFTFDKPLASGSITIPGVSGSSVVDGSTVTFTPDATIPDGEHTATASVTDGPGNTGTGSTTFTIDGTAPVKPTISSVTDPVNGANETAFSVSGNAGEAGLSVSVTVSGGGTVMASGTSGADGAFTVSGIDVSALDDGALSVTVQTADEVGNQSPVSDAASSTKDSVAPAKPSIDSVTDPVNAANKTDFSVGGDAGEAGLTVTVTVSGGGTVIASGASGAGGAFTVSGIDVSALDDGALSVTVKTTDAAGNQSPVSDAGSSTKDTVAPVKPTISSVTDPVNGANKTAFSVGGNAGESGLVVTVTVTGDGTVTASGSSGAGGAFTVSDIDVSALDDGPLSVTVKTTDAAGNQSPVSDAGSSTKDTVAPTLVSSSPADGATVTPPATVTFTFDEDLDDAGVSISGVTGSTTYAGDTATFTPDATIPDGAYTATADVLDVAGNDSSAEVSFTVDDDAAASNTTIDALPRRVTHPSPLTIAGHVTRGDDTGDYGDVDVTVTDSAGTRTIATVTPDATGGFSTTYTPTENGSYAATYLGDAENLTSTSASRTVKMKLFLKAVAPKGKASKKAKIRGQVRPAQAGVSVKVFEFTKKGRVLLGTVKTNAKGKYKLKIKLSRGSHKILVKAQSSKTYKGNKVRLDAVRT